MSSGTDICHLLVLKIALDAKTVKYYPSLSVLLVSRIFSLKKSHKISVLVLPKLEFCWQKTVKKELLMSFFQNITFDQNDGLLSISVNSVSLESKQRKHHCRLPLEEENTRLDVFVANADILKYFRKKQIVLASSSYVIYSEWNVW